MTLSLMVAVSQPFSAWERILADKAMRELSGKAGPVITEILGTVEALVQRFLAEAQDISRALGSVDRSQLGSPAGFASYDNVELLADKIHEASERDRSAVRQVEKTLEEHVIAESRT